MGFLGTASFPKSAMRIVATAELRVSSMKHVGEDLNQCNAPQARATSIVNATVTRCSPWVMALGMGTRSPNGKIDTVKALGKSVATFDVR